MSIQNLSSLKIFSATKLKGDKLQKKKHFLNDYLGDGETEKMENLRSTGSIIGAWSIPRPHVISQVRPMGVDITHGSVSFGPFCIKYHFMTYTIMNTLVMAPYMF
jgi:hypothetical protein